MNVTDSDLGAGADLTSAPVVCTGDSAWGLSGKPVYAHLVYADTGLGAESAFWEPLGFFLVMSADFARGQEGDTESAVSADIGAGVDAGFILTPIVNSHDSGQLSEPFGSVLVTMAAVSDQDFGTGVDAWLTHLTWADVDSGTGAESQFLHVASAEAGAAGEGAAYIIEVFPYPPAWLFAMGGAYQLVWRPGTPEERVISQFGQLNRGQMAEVEDIIARLMNAEDMSTVSDSDSGGGKESNLPTVIFFQLVVAPAVSCAQAGEASLVLLSGVSES